MKISSLFLVRLLFVISLALLPVGAGRLAVANPALGGYADDAALKKQIDEIAALKTANATSLGKTLGGRDVYLLTIGLGDLDAKPALLLVGNVAEPQLVGSELAVRIARQLAEEGGHDGPVKELLDKVTFYIIPRPNPDGSAKLWDRPWRERAGNDRRTDDDRDFRFGEDPPDDLNGDHSITMMRVRDDTGPYLPHADDDRIMIKADPQKNEQGSYRLYIEGRDDDEDQKYNEDASGGVSFNRNFTFDYPYFEPGAGPHQVSENATRLVADFAFEHPNIAIVFSFAPEENLMHPWKAGSSTARSRIRKSVTSADAPYLTFLAERYKKLRENKDAPPAAAGAGSFAKWAYFHYGRWSLATRAWWPPKRDDKKPPAGGDKDVQDKAGQDEAGQDASAKGKEGQDKEDQGKEDQDEGAKDKDATDKGVKDESDKDKRDKDKGDKEKRGAEERRALSWFDGEGIDAFVDWQAVDHPDFPGKKVEVGGFKPFYRSNPPAQQLDELAQVHYKFLIETVALMPHLRIVSTDAKSLGGGVFRVRAVVANDGYLPTMSEMGRLSRHAYPLQIALDVPKKVVFIQGSSRRQIGRLTGNGGSSEQTWLVRVTGGSSATVAIKVWAPAAGSAKATVELKTEP
jgi:hypothetical protein